MSDHDSQSERGPSFPSVTGRSNGGAAGRPSVAGKLHPGDHRSVERGIVDLRSGDQTGSTPVPPEAEIDSIDSIEVVDDLVRRRLFDLDFVDASSLDPVVEVLVARIGPPRRRQVSTVLTPNVDIMVQLDRDRSRSGPVWEMFRSSQFCLPDGQPIVLASRLLGRPLSARLTGSGLFPLLWPRLVDGGRSMHVVASSDEVANRLRAEYPPVTITVPPVFDAGDASAIERVANAIVTAAAPGSPEFVFLGVGHPKDALIARAVLRKWPEDFGRPPTLLALGGSAAMYVGVTRRAPEWVQRIGMEWFYRFVQEPRRLFRRYFVRDTAFLGLVWREWWAERRNRRGGPDEPKAAG
jgi:N-acetylglucosaminyldiphosphoundecaprenol N-acetyl-beta-D-mannosaminyltransferase